MSDYRSQYEKYYKNIMNQGKNTNSNNKIRESFHSADRGNSMSRTFGIQNKNEKKKFDIVTKLIRQLSVSAILLILIFLIKVIPIQKTKDAYMISKQLLNQKTTYSNVIDTINTLKTINIKGKAEECIEAIKIKTKDIGEISIKEKIKDKYCLPVLAPYIKLQGDITGVLIQAEEGQQVVCSMDGIVRKIIDNEDGKNIVVDHGDGIETYYGMIKNSDLTEGNQVKKGEYLGDCNKISGSEKSGVIFKFIYMGKEQDPTEYLDFSNMKNL